MGERNGENAGRKKDSHESHQSEAEEADEHSMLKKKALPCGRAQIRNKG